MAGRGDRFINSWNADRTNRFEPAFKAMFAHYGTMIGDEYPDAQYTLIFKTTYTDPGYNVFVSRKKAKIDAEVLIVETGKPSHVLAKLRLLKVPGRNFRGTDLDTAMRIEEAYALAGKSVAKFPKQKHQEETYIS